MNKLVQNLTIEDYKLHPLWRFVSGDDRDHDEMAVEPVLDYPVHDFGGCLAATTFVLNNRSEHFGVITDIEPYDEVFTKEFISLSLFIERKLFHLARYFDIGYRQNGPRELCVRLGLTIEDVFPIKYDLSDLVLGLRSVVTGQIDAFPKEQISEQERLNMIMTNLKKGIKREFRGRKE